MNTIEIGRETHSTGRPVVDVQSAWLKLESRVENVGGAPGDLFHARSFPSARRIVLISGLDRTCVDGVVGLGDELPEPLTAGETASAVLEALGRSARSSGNATQSACCFALRFEGSSVEWGAFGDGVMVLRRPRGFWRAQAVEILPWSWNTGTKIICGSVRTVRGDALLAWAGRGLTEQAAASLMIDAPETRAARVREMGGRGCIAAIQRFEKTWREISI